MSSYFNTFFANFIGVPMQLGDVNEFMWFDKSLSQIWRIFNEYVVLPGVRQEFSDAVLSSLRLAIVNAIT
jgi:hypothetical protein